MTMLDGPAEGWTPGLGRAPWYLRVVEDTRAEVPRANRFDALDQPEDEPREHEDVHVYFRVSTPGFACGRGAGASSTFADYVHMTSVDGAEFRKTEAWRAWCEAPEQVARCEGAAAVIEARAKQLVADRRAQRAAQGVK